MLSLLLDFGVLIVCYHDNTHLSGLLKKGFLLAAFYAVMAQTQSMSIFVLYSVFGDRATAQTADLHAQPVLARGAYVISLLLMILCLLFCERFRRVEAVYLSWRNWFMLLAMPGVSIAFVWLFYPFGKVDVDMDTARLISATSVMLLSLNLFMFFIYRSVARSAAVRERYKDLEQYCGHLNALL